MHMLKVDDLSITYKCSKMAVEHISLDMQKGDILAVVGESGSGKSTLLRAVGGMLAAEGQISEGQILFDNVDIQTFTKKKWQQVHGEEIAMIFQNAGMYLNPRRTIGSQYMEVLKYHQPLSKKERKMAAGEMLLTLHFEDPESVLKAYPFQLSGGMKQRVMIAMAMSLKPKLLLADEPTSALDTVSQAQVVREMMSMRDMFGTAIMIVTHNMGVAAHMADHIIVMKDGHIEECGTKKQIIEAPQKDYTRQLLSVVPKMEESI